MKLSLRPLSGVVIGVFATWSWALADVRIGSVIRKEYNGALGLRIGAASDRLYSDRDIFSDEKVTTPSGGGRLFYFSRTVFSCNWAIAPRSSSIARGQAKEARWCSPRVSIALSGAAAPVK